MFPYFDLFWTHFSMMAIGVFLSFIVFIVSCVVLTKKNHQDFLKIFYWLPVLIIFSYFLWRIVSYWLEFWTFFPKNINEFFVILSPKNFKFHFVGLLFAFWICFIWFFSSIKRTENKRIRADILFISLANSLIVLWIFLTLWDTVIWKPTEWPFAIRTLVDNSDLTKFDGVYPVWLFLSFWALLVHIIISVLSIVLKKNWLWMWGFVWLLLVFLFCFPFWYYTRYWIISLFWISLDVNQYFSFFLIFYFIIAWCNWKKRRFY